MQKHETMNAVIEKRTLFFSIRTMTSMLLYMVSISASLDQTMSRIRSLEMMLMQQASELRSENGRLKRPRARVLASCGVLDDERYVP